MIPSDAERQREALIRKLTDIARKRAVHDIKVRQWALDYVAKNGASNADEAVREAQTLLDFLADEHLQENDS